MVEEAAVWEPIGTERLNPADAPSLIVIAGESGSGKSHQVKLLCEDPDYGVDNVFVALSEPHALTTYNHKGLRYRWTPDLASAEGLVREFAHAAGSGKRIPRVLVWDNVSATGDEEFKQFREKPLQGASGARDKRAEYGDWGDRFIATMSLFSKSRLPCDVIALVSTAGKPPELLLPGRIVPKNLARLTSATFYLDVVHRKVAVDEILATPESDRYYPHRSFGRTPGGQFDGNVVERFFITMHTGEVLAKGHHTLNFAEPAILPDILRKIHGTGGTKGA